MRQREIIRYSNSFKQQVVRELESGRFGTVAEAKEHYGIKHQIITPVYVSELVGGKLVNRGTMMPTLP